MKPNLPRRVAGSHARQASALCLLLLASLTVHVGAQVVYYVNLNSTNPVPPYNSWATAATNIQDAVDAATLPGALVLVADGVYGPSVAVSTPLSLRSINGPQFTQILGAGLLGGMPCVHLAVGAQFCGFTVTNGYRGLLCDTQSVLVSNCVVCGNSVYGPGGGVLGGTLNNCVLCGNSAIWYFSDLPRGGGACESVLNSCLVISNSVYDLTCSGQFFLDGGGAAYCTLNGCTLACNSVGGFPRLDCSRGFGGGASYSTLNGCLLANNLAQGEQGSEIYVGGEGGGAFASCLVDCVLTGNVADDGEGGGVAGCALLKCELAANSAATGGGASASYGVTELPSLLTQCTLSANSAYVGGGAFNSDLEDCALFTNNAAYGGGAAGSTLRRCTLIANTATYGGAAAGDVGSACVLQNCSVFANSAQQLGGATAGCSLTNCSVAGNWAGVSGGGLVCWDTNYSLEKCRANDCVVYDNSAGVEANYDTNIVLDYCCTTPMPMGGYGNITSPPLFVDGVSGNLRLQSNSPCINSGKNEIAPASVDLDGNPRISGGTVDMGAYEFQNPASAISYAWLQQYGLPTDGSADFADPDGDGMNNWQEWRCGTNPTNALSALRMLPPAIAGTHVIVSWQSVAGINYFLERGTSPVGSFVTIQTTIPGLPGATTFVDTNSPGAGPVFYRVGVGPWVGP